VELRYAGNDKNGRMTMILAEQFGRPFRGCEEIVSTVAKADVTIRAPGLS
jgi:hypothetical protein